MELLSKFKRQLFTARLGEEKKASEGEGTEGAEGTVELEPADERKTDIAWL